MKNFLVSTALQSTGALVAIDSVNPDIVGFGTQDLKQQVIAVVAGVVVSVVRWAIIKYIKPIFVKNKVEVDL